MADETDNGKSLSEKAVRDAICRRIEEIRSLVSQIVKMQDRHAKLIEQVSCLGSLLGLEGIEDIAEKAAGWAEDADDEAEDAAEPDPDDEYDDVPAQRRDNWRSGMGTISGSD